MTIVCDCVSSKIACVNVAVFNAVSDDMDCFLVSITQSDTVLIEINFNDISIYIVCTLIIITVRYCDICSTVSVYDFTVSYCSI